MGTSPSGNQWRNGSGFYPSSAYSSKPEAPAHSDAPSAPSLGGAPNTGLPPLLSSSDRALSQVGAFNVRFGLTPAENALLIRELLRLPEEMKDLLALLSWQVNADGSPMEASFPGEFLPDQVVWEALAQWLGDRAKDGLQTLLKQAQTGPGGAMFEAYPMSDTIRLLTHLEQSPQNGPADMLKNLFLLYFPGQPPVPRAALTLKFEHEDFQPETSNEKGGGTESEPVDTLILYLETGTLGLFKLTFSLEGRIRFSVRMLYESAAASFLEAIRDKFLIGLRQEGLPEPVIHCMLRNKPIEPAKEASADVKTEKRSAASRTRQPKLYPLQPVPGWLVLAAYRLSCVILETDARCRLLVDPLSNAS